jgi:outer membrane protein OmpA-like peptidoglycan-associated protein
MEGYMPEALLASLSSAVKRSDLEGLARNMGEPEQTVSRGLELSAASIFSGLARRAGDSDALRQLLDLASKTPANAVSSALSSGQLSNPNSPLMASSERFLSSLFGGGQSTVVSSIARETGMRTAAASTVMALGAQSVLSYIGNRVRDEGMTPTSLAGFLQRESASLRGSLPAGFNEAFTTTAPVGPRIANPVIAQAVETNPVVAQTVRKERSFWPWLIPLAVILLGLLWFASRQRRPEPQPVPPAPVAEAPAPVQNLGNFVTRQLPDNTTLNIPENGVESRLLAFIQDPNRTPDSTTWFDFDRLLFDTGSATLQPQSDEQLRNIAAILKAYPNVHLRIGGYTDNVGSADANLKLSQDRANNVMAELVRLGVAPDRLDARGYGEDHPVADNSTEAGRAQNRRISMLVTQK